MALAITANEWRSVTEAPTSARVCFPPAFCTVPGGDDRVGPYRLWRKLGEGGMSAVHLASRGAGLPHELVALKLARWGSAAPHVLACFHNERRILAGLDHPQIPRMLDADSTPDGQPYLALEHVPGVTIDAYCEGHALGVEGRLRLLLSVCAAVQYLHRNRIVHGDLKPTNILVTAQGVPKLLDFGIARRLCPFPETPLASAPRLCTPDYASPEQVATGHPTTAGDIYSLGALLHSLLTGRPPRRNRRYAHPEVERATTAAHRGLAPGLDRVMLKALQREPWQRHPSVEDFCDDLLRLLARS